MRVGRKRSKRFGKEENQTYVGNRGSLKASSSHSSRIGMDINLFIQKVYQQNAGCGETVVIITGDASQTFAP
jgi:hypothetical protein